ncbi:MAG: hypothetical protein WCD35_05155, partial [Mycobacteriales bacterium]
MRTTLTVVDSESGHRADVLVELDARAAVSALEAALRDLVPGAGRGLWLDGRPLEPTRTVAETEIRPGCVLALGAPPDGVLGPDGSRVALHVVSGPAAGDVHPLPDGCSTVGSLALAFEDPALLPRHLELHSGPAGVVAALPAGVVSSSAQVRCNGAVLTAPAPVGPRDLLELGRHLLSVVPHPSATAAVTSGPDLARRLTRPPRLLPADVVTTLALPTPPAAPAPRRLPVLPLLLPALLGAVMAVLSSPLYLLFALMSPLLAVSTWWSDRRHGRAEHTRAAREHEREQARVREQLNRLLASEATARRAAFPDAAALLVTARGPGPRLWERRRDDPDRLVLRVGTGSCPAEAVRLDGAPPPLPDVPVTVPLGEVGVLGVAGPGAAVRALARFLVGQAVVLHSPRDLGVVLLVDPARGDTQVEWDWVRWLPHATAGSDACAAQVGVTPDALGRRVAELAAL